MLFNFKTLAVVLILFGFIFPVSGKSPGRCATCGRSIVSSFSVFEGKNYCSEVCVEKLLPTCHQCQKRIISNFIKVENRNYCSDECFDLTISPCEICGLRNRSYVLVEGVPFCEKHAKGPFCEICLLPVKTKADVGDGRLICKSCHQSRAVLTGSRMDLIYQATWKQFSAFSMNTSGSLPVVKMVNKTALNFLLGKTFRDNDIHRSQGFYLRKEETGKPAECTIYLLSAMDEPLVYAVGYHETMHHWLAENYSNVSQKLSHDEHEGLCQWVSWRLCSDLGNVRGVQIIEKDTDPVYGDGFRKVKAVLKEGNVQDVRRWLEQDKGLKVRSVSGQP